MPPVTWRCFNPHFHLSSLHLRGRERRAAAVGVAVGGAELLFQTNKS